MSEFQVYWMGRQEDYHQLVVWLDPSQAIADWLLDLREDVDHTGG